MANSYSSSSSALEDENYQRPECSRRPIVWEFIINLLEQEGKTCVQWIDREKLVFKVMDRDGLAKEWGKRRGDITIKWTTIAHAIRFHYNKKNKDVLEKVEGQHFTYRFIKSRRVLSFLNWKRRTNASSVPWPFDTTLHTAMPPTNSSASSEEIFLPTIYNNMPMTDNCATTDNNSISSNTTSNLSEMAPTFTNFLHQQYNDYIERKWREKEEKK